ncbi:MAG: hypothetical protein J6U84_04675 [Bacteroidales bacterium]|nr:hypothetical protein [Bacteroidales bacterium]
MAKKDGDIIEFLFGWIFEIFGWLIKVILKFGLSVIGGLFKSLFNGIKSLFSNKNNTIDNE